MKKNAVDVLIVGAGIAGSATALELNRWGYTVGLLHREGDVPAAVETLSPAATQRLRELGVESGLPMPEVVAWWGSDKEQRMSYDDARVVQRTVLAEQLRNHAADCGVKTISVSRHLVIDSYQDGLWNISASRTHLFCQYLIDATGRSSVLGRRLGARREATDNLFCLSFPVHATCAGTWTETTRDGWWNVSCNDREGTVSFYSIPEIIHSARRSIDIYWSRTKYLKLMFECRAALNASLRACYSSRLTQCGGPGWLAVGDAAWTVHPLASGGVAKALADADQVPRFLNDPDRYNLHQSRQYNSYSKQLTGHYSLEPRWKGEQFWSRLSSVKESVVVAP